MATLGCGAYTAALAHRGGAVIFPDLPVSGVAWERVASDVSKASVTLAADARCVRALAQTDPWSHEIVLYRDSTPLWLGPVVGRNGLTVPAADLAVWLDRRWFRRDLRFDRANLADILQDVVSEAMRSDHTPRLGVTVESRPDTVGDREYRAGKHSYTGEAARELGRSGAEWTVSLRSLLVNRRRTRDTPEVPELRDDHLVNGPSELSTDGMLMGNSWGVRGLQPQLSDTADDAVWGSAVDPESVRRYGLLDRVATEDTIRDSESARAAAAERLAATRQPIVNLGSLTLAPTAPISASHLFPGRLLRIRVEDTPTPFRQLVRIQKVAGTGSSGAETLTVTVEPIYEVPAA